MFLRASLLSVRKLQCLLLSELAFSCRGIRRVKSTSGVFSGATGGQEMLPTFEDCVFARLDSRCMSTKQYGQTRPISSIEEHTLDEEYKESVKMLNTMQSNADSIRRSIALNNKQAPIDIHKYLHRSGLSLDEVEELAFIHVSGTKGKGSTCALTESILRAHNVRTGFFSSPHLVSVRERIRINGEPISKQKFISTFGRIYKRLLQAREHNEDMPSYFKFLTIMCFHIFLEERVDAAILEVGIGGELDCTNIIRNTRTVGITSLGLEHTQLLGDTLQEIAWQKAGIIKPNSRVYTSVTQPVCLEVIKQRAAEKNATLHIVPDFEAYFNDEKSKNILTSLNNITQLNGSLAMQLAYDWMRIHKNGLHRDFAVNSTQVTNSVLDGLVSCNWPGRCQMVTLRNFRIHLDGAHTVESMCVCSDWFQRTADSNHIPKVLIFNTTGDRDSKKLLDVLRCKNQFDFACFMPNIASGSANNNDNTSVYSITDQLKRAKMHAGNWHALCQEDGEEDSSHIFGSILDSFNFVQRQYGSQQEVDVLVTGSLHLIGATVLALNMFKTRLEQI